MLNKGRKKKITNTSYSFTLDMEETERLPSQYVNYHQIKKAVSFKENFSSYNLMLI